MTQTCTIHVGHAHRHGEGCGHTAIQHGDHIGYLHDGHLHCLHEEHVDEHLIDVNEINSAACTPSHNCGGHDQTHTHGPGGGYEAVPHEDHIDYLVNGHLHHSHGDHCDDHGRLSVVYLAHRDSLAG